MSTTTHRTFDGKMTGFADSDVPQRVRARRRARSPARRGATGKPLATIDKSIVGDPIELSGDDWAFWHIETGTLVVANAKTGRLGRSIALSGPRVKNGGGASLVTHRTTDKKLLLAALGDAGSGVVVYDLATKKQTHYLPPLCKK